MVEDGVVHGLTFTGAATGEVPGTSRASIDYVPGITSTIVGGTWSVSGTDGAVSESFLSGTIQWDDQNEHATITTIMKALGRSGTYAILPREARFDGTLDLAASPHQLAGVLTMYR